MSDTNFNSKSTVVIIDDNITFPIAGTHSTTWSGIWASAQTGNVIYQRVDNLVTLFIPQITATANTAASIVIDTVLPTNLRPTTAQYVMGRNVDNGTISSGTIFIQTDGTINMYRNAASANFTGSGTSGFYATTFGYLIN